MDSRLDWKKITVAATVALITVSTAGVLYASSGEGGGVSSEKLWDLLWRTLNFIALVIILVKFLAKPLANAMRSRQQSIADRFEDLEAKKSAADRIYKEYEGKLAQIDQEVKGIIENAIAQGEAEKQRIITDAERAAGDLKRQAEMAVQHEIAGAKLLLREEVASQAMLLAEELIKKNLKEADQVKIIDDYLEKVGTIQ